MTIQVTPCRESSLFIQPHKTFYPTKLPLQHPQLKNFISTHEAGIIYFASKHHIFAIHLPTGRRERIVSLSLRPQCLGAGYGWICVGGLKNGRCAFIDINECFLFSSDSNLASIHSEVDALLPLDLDPHIRMQARDIIARNSDDARPPRRTPKVTYHMLGELIVNSVTVHKLQSGKGDALNEVVAILTNNDKTVRIWSLSQGKILSTIEFPTEMNYATLSPDSQLLLAVGDQPRAFFIRRHPQSNPSEPSMYPTYEWKIVADPKLPTADYVDACFTTAFHPAGHVCAVATQAGTIVVFDTSLAATENGDGVIAILKSTRQDYEDMRGAVRSMAFSPAPWDLFAWAEDQGRVCVTDLRDVFRTRQTVVLDINGTDTERVELEDFEDEYSSTPELEIEARFLQRHREAMEAQDTLAAGHSAVADYLQSSAARRLRVFEQSEANYAVFNADPLEITEDERQLLEMEAVDRHRIRERARRLLDANLAGRPFSLHYNNSAATSSTSPTVPRTSLHQYMRERTVDRPRMFEPRNPPRRRSSVVISNGSSSNPLSSENPASLAPIDTTTSTLSASPSRLPVTTGTFSPRPTISLPPPAPLPIPSSTSDPWHAISSAMANSPAQNTDATLNVVARLRRERGLDVQQRDFDHERERDRDRERELEIGESSISSVQRSITTAGTRGDRSRASGLRQLQEQIAAAGADAGPEFGDYEVDLLRRLGERARIRMGEDDAGIPTMGIGWTPDGRSLFVGTEEGILGLRVILEHRKTFPAMSFR